MDLLTILHLAPTLVALWFTALWARDRHRDRRDQKRMAHEYRTTGPGRPTGPQEHADLTTWLQQRHEEKP